MAAAVLSISSSDVLARAQSRLDRDDPSALMLSWRFLAACPGRLLGPVHACPCPRVALVCTYTLTNTCVHTQHAHARARTHTHTCLQHAGGNKWQQRAQGPCTSSEHHPQVCHLHAISGAVACGGCATGQEALQGLSSAQVRTCLQVVNVCVVV